MNLDQTTAIRIAIRDTTGAIARQETPEPTRTALQAYLDALLKEELRALTGQALAGNLAGFAEQNEKFAQDMGLRKDPEPPIYENLWLQATNDLNAAMDLVQQNQEFFGAQCGDDKIKVIGEFFVKWAAVMMMKPEATHAPWYPDNSGAWVEVSDDRMACPVAETMLIDYLLLGERTRQSHTPTPQNASELDWGFATGHPARVVAYKVVKP